MKNVIFALSLMLLALSSHAAVYDCHAILGSWGGPQRAVDTRSNLDYVWIFKGRPGLQMSCGAAIESNTLQCVIKKWSPDDPSSPRIFASAEIQIGDKLLVFSSPDCEKNSGGCGMKCTLNHID